MRRFNIAFVTILGMVVLLHGCSWAPPPTADWGDAPDPDESMDTSYYAPRQTPADPGVITYVNAGVDALFPADNVGPQGPYMTDVDEFWIGPFATAPFFTVPATPAPGDITDGGVYWNALFDTDQSGEWNSGPNRIEWVAQDQFVPVTVNNQIVISPAFQWGSSGAPFGRLLFPVWARSMVSEAPVGIAVAHYHGEGPDGGFGFGFGFGEVEDYFIEWRPIGQILPGGPDDGDGDAARYGIAEDLVMIEGPDEVAAGGVATLYPDERDRGVAVVCAPGGTGGVAELAVLEADADPVPVCADKSIQASGRRSAGEFEIEIETAPPGEALIVLASRGADDDAGTGAIPVYGAKLITLK